MTDDAPRPAWAVFALIGVLALAGAVLALRVYRRQAVPAVPADDPAAAMAAPLAQLGMTLDNPAVMKGLTPDKARRLRELHALLLELQENLRSGKPVTDRQKARLAQFSAEGMKGPAEGATQPMPERPRREAPH